MTHPGVQTRSAGYQRVGLILVALGAMVVSISGQVQSAEAKLGIFFAVVLALTNDVGALLALDALLSAPRKSAIRVWAWVAIGCAAGTGGVLNAWHATAELVPAPNCAPDAGSECEMVLPELPDQLGLLLGVEPIVLVLVLSHLLGLVVAHHQAQRAASVGHQDEATSRGDHQPTQIVVTTRPPADHQAPPPAHHQAPPPGRGHQTSRALPATTSSHQTTSPRPATSPHSGTSPVPAKPTGPSRPAVRPAAHSAAHSAVQGGVQGGGRPALHAVGTRRPGWLTDDLLARALAAVQAGGANYGRKQLMDDLEVKDWKARDLLKYIGDHNLVRKSA